MTESIQQIGELLGTRRRTTWSVVLVGVEVMALAIAFAARSDFLMPVTAALVAIPVLLGALRWPLAALFAFAALIPVEEIFQAGDLGTISRIAAIAFALTYGLPRIRSLHYGAMPWPAWLFVGWALASLTWAIEPGLTLTELPTLLQLFLISVLIADVVTKRPEVVRPLLWTYSVGAGMTAIVGILAYLSGDSSNAQRLSAFADQDPAQFAAILLPALVLSVYELVNGRLVLLSGVVAATTLIGIILSGTRGSWLAAGIVAVVLILPRLRPQRRFAAVVLMVALVLLAYQVPGVQELVAKRTLDAVPTGGAGRTDIWAVAVNIIGSSPLAGVGFADFSVAYTPERVRDAAIVAYTDPSFPPHSIIFGTVGELGLLGLVILAMFILPLVLRRGWGPDAAAVQAMLASVMIAALFLDVLNRKQVWLVIGVAAGLAWLDRKHRTSAETSVPSGGERQSTTIEPVIPASFLGPSRTPHPEPSIPGAATTVRIEDRRTPAPGRSRWRTAPP